MSIWLLPRNRLMDKAASFLLASLRGSTYALGKRLFLQAMVGA